MIITVTLNPALDKTAELETLVPGELNRLKNMVTDIGGKGVNVSKMIQALGGSSVATGFLGGGSGEEIAKALKEMGIGEEFIRVLGTTRTNMKVLDCGSRLTELNEPGVLVTAGEVEELTGKIYQMANEKTIVVLAGSLAGGLPTDFYAKLIRIVHEKGGRAFLDADGDAFREALLEKPDFIKPNRHELTEYFGVTGEPDLQELKELCVKLKEMGIVRTAVSMGADGAIFAGEEGMFYAPGLRVEAHSSVGAGDSMMGAFAYGTDRNMGWRDTAVLSVAASAGAVTTTGTKPPRRELVDRLLGQVAFQQM